MSTVEIEIPLRRKGRPRTNGLNAPPTVHVPRIARLMALAIKFQDMVGRGEVRDYADLGRLGYVSRARITQIMNLLNLAPDIQQELLGLTGSTGPVLLTESRLRELTSRVSWADQRRLWRRMLPSGPVSPSDRGRA